MSDFLTTKEAGEILTDIHTATCRHGFGRAIDIKSVQSAIDEVEGAEISEADKAFALQQFQAMKDRDLLALIDDQ